MHTIGDLQPIVHTSPPITETLILTRINPTPLNQHEKYQRCSLCYYLSLSREQAMQHIRLKHANEIVKPELNMGPIFSDSKCDKCKLKMSCNLIDLPCSRNLSRLLSKHNSMSRDRASRSKLWLYLSIGLSLMLQTSSIRPRNSIADLWTQRTATSS